MCSDVGGWFTGGTFAQRQEPERQKKCDKAVVNPCGCPSTELPTRARNAQPDCACHGRTSDQLQRRLARTPVSYRENPQEKGQSFVAVADRCRNPGTGLGPFGSSYSARDIPVTEPLPGSPWARGPEERPTPRLAGAPSPRGPDLVFHDPLSNFVVQERTDAGPRSVLPDTAALHQEGKTSGRAAEGGDHGGPTRLWNPEASKSSL